MNNLFEKQKQPESALKKYLKISAIISSLIVAGGYYLSSDNKIEEAVKITKKLKAPKNNKEMKSLQKVLEQIRQTKKTAEKNRLTPEEAKVALEIIFKKITLLLDQNNSIEDLNSSAINRDSSGVEKENRLEQYRNEIIRIVDIEQKRSEKKLLDSDSSYHHFFEKFPELKKYYTDKRDTLYELASNTQDEIDTLDASDISE